MHIYSFDVYSSDSIAVKNTASLIQAQAWVKFYGKGAYFIMKRLR